MFNRLSIRKKSKRAAKGPAFDGRLPPPDAAAVETTRYCNLRCRMCIQFLDGTTVTGPHMDMADFERVAESVFPFVKHWQPSLSGEPLVSKGFLKMLEIAHAFGVKTDIVTNGTLLTDAMIEKLVPGLGRIAFSIDGSEKEVFESIREGANFEKTMERIKNLVNACKEHFSADECPAFGVRATIMERNIRDLPSLVDFAATELDLDFVTAVHVFPASDDMKPQSLVHHVDLARSSIDEAFKRARKHKIKLELMALDQIMAATAAVEGSDRELAVKDGAIEGLETRVWSAKPLPPIPELSSRHSDYEAVVTRRAKAFEEAGFPSAVDTPVQEKNPDSIWWCDYLWNRTYIHIGGDVKPCCIYGAPTLGNIKDEDFRDIWNNNDYRAFRQKLVMKDPMPCCRGCASSQEITDPKLIHEFTQGLRIPNPEEVAPVSPGLNPDVAAGYWQGTWTDDGRQRLAILQLAVEGDRWSGRYKEPSSEIPWTELVNVRCDDRYVDFDLPLNGELLDVKSRVHISGESIRVTIFKKSGEQLEEFHLLSVSQPGEMEGTTRWKGQISIDGGRQDVALTLGVRSGRAIGFYRLPGLLGDTECQLGGWSITGDEFLVDCDMVPSIGGRLRFEGVIQSDGATVAGTCRLERELPAGGTAAEGGVSASFTLNREA